MVAHPSIACGRQTVSFVKKLEDEDEKRLWISDIQAQRLVDRATANQGSRWDGGVH